MAYSEQDKAQLRRLYVFEKLSLDKAAQQMNVSYATASRWKNQAFAAGDDWEKLRAAHTMTDGTTEDLARQILTDLVLQFKMTMDLLRNDALDSTKRVALLTSLSDSYNKAISANQKLLPKTSELAVCLSVIEKLTAYIKEHKPSLLIEFLDVLEPFGEQLEREFK